MYSVSHGVTQIPTGDMVGQFCGNHPFLKLSVITPGKQPSPMVITESFRNGPYYPQHGLMNLWLITMDMGLCCVSCPSPTNYIQPHPIPQHVLSPQWPHHEHPATPLQLPYHTTPHQGSNVNNTSTILAKCIAEHCASPENDIHSGGGGGLTFFRDQIFLWQNY